MSSQLQKNLRLAEEACKYVIDTRKIKAANWDFYHGEAGTFEECVNDTRNMKKCREIKGKMKPDDFHVYDPRLGIRAQRNAAFLRCQRPGSQSKQNAKPGCRQTPEEYHRLTAEVAEKRKHGNCGEMAAVALEYVKGKGVSLDWVDFKDTRGVEDHSVLVIGRLPNSNLNKPQTWGRNAVVCDPWMYGLKGSSDNADDRRAKLRFGVYVAARLPDRLQQVFKSRTLRFKQNNYHVDSK